MSDEKGRGKQKAGARQSHCPYGNVYFDSLFFI